MSVLTSIFALFNLKNTKQMKKISLIAMLALVCNFALAQIQQTSYKGAFAPAPKAMWTAGWTNFDPNQADYGTPTVQISADITANTTWTATNVYQLNGLITVRNNATLTIQPGTVIRSSATASALLIARGAKLIANGTAADPIVFTSNSAKGSRTRGDWGGIVMLGRANYNINNGVNYIEGITQNAITEFGGGLSPILNDNSGILKYVRIEFAGYVLSPNNELNGLTMGAVGSGTTIENVQVSYSNDDSFEWFGGSVNCKNLIAFAGLDDDFDVDNGYNGIVQFGLAIKDPLAADISTSEIFEVDNNASGTAGTGYTSAIFSNITTIGAAKRPNGVGTFVTPNPLHDRALRLRRASQINVFNSIFLDSKVGLRLESALTNTAYSDGTAKFKNNLIVSATPFNRESLGTQTFALATGNNTTATATADVLTNAYNGTDATNYKLIGETGGAIDYRPLADSDAATLANFDDAKITALVNRGTAPAVSNPASYCKGAIAQPLTATMTANGVSLRWYTTNVTPVYTTVYTTAAPVPATSAVGAKSYFVREVDANGAVSNVSTIVVTVVDAPTAKLGKIIADVLAPVYGNYIGTTTTIKYAVSTVAGVSKYFWTVPAGANIIAGQDSNEITVNFANVPSGILKVGDITVQAKSEAGCLGAAVKLSIDAALPKAPKLIVTDDLVTKTTVVEGANVTTLVPIKSFAPYMGTERTVQVTATPGASSYAWELPAGVNLVGLGTPTITTLYYSLFPFVTSSTTAPTTAGNVYYAITTNLYSNGTKIVTGRMIRNARNAGAAGSGIAAITASNVELTNLTNEGVAINPAYPITSTTSNSISVNFAGVTTANTTNYTDAKGISTNALRFGVKAMNGVGASVVANTALINPTTTSTAALLTLTATKPAASKAVMTNGVTTTAIADISKFVGTTTAFTLTASPSPLASSYDWELPTGVTLVSGTLTSRVITVHFNNVAAGAKTLYVGVKAVNGMGSSSTTNVTPFPATTYSYLKLAAVLPAVAKLAGTASVCKDGTGSYTITPSPLATSYVITAPAGSVVTSASNTTNDTNVLTTSDLAFTVKYNNLASPKPVQPVLSIVSVNGVGFSLAGSFKLTSTGACTPASKIAATKAVATVSATEVYPNPVSNDFNIDVTAAQAGVLSIAIYSLDNNLVVSPKTVQLQAGVNTINENVSSLNKGIYIVQLVNSSNGEVITKKLVKN
jgi:hypothetical protein